MRIRRIAPFAVAGLVLALVSGAGGARGAAEPGVVNFTAVGDYGASATTQAVLSGIADQDPDLHLALGDLSYGATGAEQQWCDFVTSEVGQGFPFQLIAGNHESNGQNGNINDFSACLPNQLPGLVGTYGRQWYVDVPQSAPLVRFVTASPALPFPDGTWSYAQGSPRYNWMAQAIDGARAAGIPWVVVGMHKPCLSLGSYACEMPPDLVQLLMTKRVDLVLSSHDHTYQRTKQLATSAACASLRPGTYDAACVVDGDSDLTKGRGTVFVNVGTGGVGLYDVSSTDSEVDYFAAYSGANRQPSSGFLDVRASADSLDARFVSVAGGTLADSFTVRRGTAAPNQPPAAAFTSSVLGLTASFDGRGSTDPDGSISSYAWDFGDGTTGGGATPQHTYAVAGTYQVRLAVTDDGGAVSPAVTTTVTVTAPQTPPGPQAFVLDSFDRTVSNGLGTADTGGVWTTSGTAANFAVASQAAVLTLRTAPTQLSAWLGATTRTDTDLRATFSVDKVPTGGLYIDLAGRRVSTNNEYRARVALLPSGDVNMGLTGVRASTAVTIGAERRAGFTYASGTKINLRLQVTGTGPTTLRLKVWPATAPEPAAWQMTGTDSSANLQTAGAVGLTAYLSSSATNAPVTLRVTELSARPTS